MPRKILTKFARFGYVGQVVTAGFLLTVAVLLMFAVIGTLEPMAKPPTANPIPPPERRQQEQAVIPDALPQEQLLISQPEVQLPSTGATAETAKDKNRKTTGEQLIRELWNGKIIGDFGWQFQPLYQDWRYHNGIDVSGGEGQIVPALTAGEILEIYTDKQYGLTVGVKYDSQIITYGSLASVVVQQHSKIQAGDPLGSMGVTRNKPEPHLHVAVQEQERKEYLNPRELFPDIPK
ncbi:MAG: Peptidase family [Firmicutes bacterium]|nr:Peptidase family [Bacillota bacterium]